MNNLLKIMSPILAAAFIAGGAADSSAAQCKRVPSNGTLPFPGLGFKDERLNVTCADGTKGDLTADHLVAQRKVIAKLKVKVTAAARARAIGANNIGGGLCVAESKVVNQSKSANCDATIVRWTGEIRND